MQAWIWQQPDWPRFGWDTAHLAPLLSRARLAQGKVLGAVRMLDPTLTLEAVAAVEKTALLRPARGLSSGYEVVW